MAASPDAQKIDANGPDAGSPAPGALVAGPAQKPTFENYEDWLEQELGLGPIKKEKARYDQVTAKALLDIQASRFWIDILSSAQEADDKYTRSTSYKLFTAADQYKPVLQIKPWNSFLLKTFRKNVLNNEEWPNPPDGGWWTSDNWYSKTTDIVRTTIVVKYLDGVEFLVEHTAETARANSVDFRCDFEAKDEGYYAAHAYVTIQVDVPQWTGTPYELICRSRFR